MSHATFVLSFLPQPTTFRISFLSKLDLEKTIFDRNNISNFLLEAIPLEKVRQKLSEVL